MNEPEIRVALGWGNQAALGVAEVSIRERGFRAREGGAGGFTTGTRGGAGFAGAAGAAFFAGAGRGASVRAVLTFAAVAGLADLAGVFGLFGLVGLACLAGFVVEAAFLGRGFTRDGFAAVEAARTFADFTDLVGSCFPTAFFLDEATADERPAFFPFAAGIAAPFPFLAVVKRGAQYTNAVG
jgi:hypothetical protein